jgi:hypothetical protein
LTSPPEEIQIGGTEAMIAVGIWRRPPSEGSVVGTLRMEGDRVEFSEDFEPSLGRWLPPFKCRDRSGTWLTIEDGEPWLQALPANLHGDYLWAGFDPGGERRCPISTPHRAQDRSLAPPQIKAGARLHRARSTLRAGTGTGDGVGAHR